MHGDGTAEQFVVNYRAMLEDDLAGSPEREPMGAESIAVGSGST